VVEPAVRGHRRIERLLARVAEGRVAKIVGQSQGLGQVFVQVQRPRQRPRDLRHLERVRQAGAIVVALVVKKHLRLVLEAAEGRRVDDAVSVALERGPTATRRFGDQTAPAVGRIGGVWRTLDGPDDHRHKEEQLMRESDRYMHSVRAAAPAPRLGRVNMPASETRANHAFQLNWWWMGSFAALTLHAPDHSFTS